MRKQLLWLLAAVLSLAACGGGNGLLKDASPSTSALTLFRYDGETAAWGTLYDCEEEEALLAALSSVKAKRAPEWTPALVTAPVYGLSIGSTDGYFLEAVWSNGCWIDQDGTAYRFDCDWEALLSGYSWEDERSWPSINALPCARYLVQQGEAWFPDRMTPAEALEAPEGISMALTGREEDTLTVAFVNSRAEEWNYGLYFSIQILLDGVWYSVPPMPESWIIPDIAYIIPAGESWEQTYDITPYGPLPAGQYRLAAAGMAVEFTVA